MNRRCSHSLLAFCLMPVLLAGCSYHATRHEVDSLLPVHYDQGVDPTSARVVTMPEHEWWRRFDMPELDAMLAELEKANYDLDIARQRVVRSRALLGKRRSTHWPTLDGSVTGSRTFREQPVLGHKNTGDEDSLVFTAGYEVDLWGRRSATILTAELGVLAEHARFRSTAISLQVQLMQQYFELLSIQDRIISSKQNLAVTEDLLKLVELRVNGGRASRIELDQQRNMLLQQRSRLIVLQRDRVLVEHALAVLLGRNQSLGVEVSAHLDDAVLPVIGVVQPAVLLETRPDIAIAEANLLIRDAVVYQNRKKRWPTLQLTANATLADITQSGPSWTSSLIGQLASPIFNAGRITNEIKVAEADASIALQSYRLTVIRAIQEVLDTLSNLNHQRDIYVVRQDETETARRLYGLARQRFDAGTIDFINLLDAQRTWILATERVIAAKRDCLIATVNVYKAMGVPPELLMSSQRP